MDGWRRVVSCEVLAKRFLGEEGGYEKPQKKNKTCNFYLVIEVPDHVYVFYAYRLYFADKDIYMIRYFITR